MEKFVRNLKENLDEMSSFQPMITVKRSDLESLIEDHRQRQEMDSVEIEAVIRALRYYESDFGMTDKEWALLNRLETNSKGAK